MLAKCTATKPLYQYERQLSYEKHLLKLKQINSKGSITRMVNQSQQTKIKPWMKEKLKIETEKSNKMIEEENQKLLSKLLKISTRSSMPVNDKIMHRDNVYRKNWLKSIKRDNQQFGDKLLNLRSSLQYSRAEKSIEDYEKVKQSMKANRRPKLPLLTNKTAGGNQIRKALRTENEEVINHLNQIGSERDRVRQKEKQKQKVKTQGNSRKQKVEIDEQLHEQSDRHYGEKEKTNQDEKLDDAENNLRLSNKIQKKSQKSARMHETDI